MQRILFLDIETDGLDATQIFVCVTKDKRQEKYGIIPEQILLTIP